MTHKMKNKNASLALLSLVLIYMGYYYWSKDQRDKWAKEAPEIRYSEARENQVWGGILRGDDAGLFYGTPLYDLAKEMSGIFNFSNDAKIARLIGEIPKVYINYQEEKYGMSIGHFALMTNNMFAIRKLLDRGLNPNLIDKSGDAIIIHINGPFTSRLPESLETLKYMIKKGADVNLHSPKASLTTPLIEAANSNFENVKVLIEAGANPHFIDKSAARPFQSALSAALVNRRMKIINYLIFDQKVDFRTLKHPITSKFHPGEYQILYNLRDLPFELNTKEYQEKMRLVAYLKTQGLDYWNTPIPEYIKTNPHYGNKEYLSKY